MRESGALDIANMILNLGIDVQIVKKSLARGACFMMGFMQEIYSSVIVERDIYITREVDNESI